VIRAVLSERKFFSTISSIQSTMKELDLDRADLWIYRFAARAGLRAV
jgi:hypothetical protein